ncbi:MAG: hypothetical protein NTX48_00125 [Planctomycetales bacterium]|nr:hypothetical protein [Planctomycetales bacterium]
MDNDQFFSGLSRYADNGNLPMGLLLAGTLTPGGMPGFGLAACQFRSESDAEFRAQLSGTESW